ncbi:MAG TPA: hypothetical protein VGG32_09765 [Thermoplasmata archaeon]
MAALLVPRHRRPPAIYRVARALRWVSAIVLIALVIFAGTVAYSAVEVARSSVQSRSLSASFASNGTVAVAGSFTLSNPGLYPIQGVTLTARIANSAGVFLGAFGVGPNDIAPSTTGVFPIALYLPVSASGPTKSLLTEDQYLAVNAWGNATYAYLFPLSVSLSETRYWGAPFEGFHASVGTPSGGGGAITVPIVVTFSDHASSPDVGTLAFVIESSNFVDCGGGSFPLDVPAGSLYDHTDTATLSPGCSPSGGQLLATYSSAGGTTPLPPEAIP